MSYFELREMSYFELREHIGHDVECVGYGEGGKPPFHNVALECIDCGEVLLDFDRPSVNPDEEVEP